jgi:hypothetical protein
LSKWSTTARVGMILKVRQTGGPTWSDVQAAWRSTLESTLPTRGLCHNATLNDLEADAQWPVLRDDGSGWPPRSHDVTAPGSAARHSPRSSEAESARWGCRVEGPHREPWSSHGGCS